MARLNIEVKTTVQVRIISRKTVQVLELSEVATLQTFVMVSGHTSVDQIMIEWKLLYDAINVRWTTMLRAKMACMMARITLYRRAFFVSLASYVVRTQ